MKIDWDYIDFHTHRQRHADDPHTLEIVSLHEDEEKQVNFYTLGRHPWKSEVLLAEKEMEGFKSRLDHPQCLAMGEMGLDKLKGPDLATQIEIFEQQLHIAGERQVPVVIHCVRAYDPLIQVKKNFPKISQWCVHGYGRHVTLAQQLIDQGFFLSIMPTVTDQKLKELLSALPKERWFLETDSHPAADIKKIYSEAATHLECSLESLSSQLNQNLSTFLHT